MKTKKIQLKDLKVQSFVTTDLVRGGREALEGTHYEWCENRKLDGTHYEWCEPAPPLER